jgi:hypothetical protein
MFAKIVNREIEENKYLLEYIQDSFVKSHLEACLKWYIKKAVAHKYYFYFFTFLTIFSPVVSGVILGISGENFVLKIISSVFMGISTIAAALLTMLDSRKKWGIYRNQAEIIKGILVQCYLEKENVDDLLEKIEKSMERTHEKWLENFQGKK